MDTNEVKFYFSFIVADNLNFEFLKEKGKN